MNPHPGLGGLLCCAVHGAQIAAAAKLWDGTGSLLFTGSAGIYATDDGSMVNEDSTIVASGISERNDRCNWVK